MTSNLQNKSEAREATAADLAQWEKRLGHKPTLEDIRNAMYSPAARRAQRKYEKEQIERGKADGRTWAENGRSIAALEAVYSYWNCPTQHIAAQLDLFDKMVGEIGEDEEFETLSDDVIYLDAWYNAVCDVYEEIIAA
jgi:hypothetical protein